MEHVRAQPVVEDITQSGGARQLIRTKERGVDHAGRGAHALLDEIMERYARDTLCNQRKHHETAVAVDEPFAGRKGHRVPVEHGEVLLGRRELMHGNRHHVVGPIGHCVLVEVVADARAMREKLLDGDGVIDQCEVVAEHGSRRRVEAEFAAVDHAHHGERGEALGTAGRRELGSNGIGYAERPLSHSTGLFDGNCSFQVNPHHAGQTYVVDDPLHPVGKSTVIMMRCTHTAQVGTVAQPKKPSAPSARNDSSPWGILPA